MPRCADLIGPCHSPEHFYATRDRENSAWALLRRWELLAVPRQKWRGYLDPFANGDDNCAYKYQEQRRIFATSEKCLTEYRDPRNVPVCHFFQSRPREALIRLVPVEICLDDEALAEWLFLKGGPYLHCHFCKRCWAHNVRVNPGALTGPWGPPESWLAYPDPTARRRWEELCRPLEDDWGG